MSSAFLHRRRPRRSSPHGSSAKLLRRSSSRFCRPPARLRELNWQQIHRSLCILHRRSAVMCRLLASVPSSHSLPAPSPICAASADSQRGWRRVIEASSTGALPFTSPSVVGRFESVLRRFDPVRADSSPSRGGPLLSLLERSCLCVSYTATPPLCPNLDAGVAAAHSPKLDLAGIRQLPATTFSWGAFSLEAVI